jgi:hypothetical protein
MKRFLLVPLWAIILLAAASGQDHPYTFNIGGGPGFPVGDISNFSNVGGHFMIGGGANLTPRFGFDGEFMWHDLPPKSSIVALTGAPNGSAGLYSLTGNLLVRSARENKLGFYGIGGIGWYHRTWELTAPTLALGTSCLPSYVWWGVACSNGLVSSNVTLRSGSSDGFGYNAGAGITFRIRESYFKVFAEVRYHHAFQHGVDTTVLPLTFGIRY